MILANSTALPLQLKASDSRLSIIREALDEDGEWKPIEYLPKSWCGNSYHHVTLPSEHYWSFAAPVYAGPHRVQMRFVLDLGQMGWMHFMRDRGSLTSRIEDLFRQLHGLHPSRAVFRQTAAYAERDHGFQCGLTFSEIVD